MTAAAAALAARRTRPLASVAIAFAPAGFTLIAALARRSFARSALPGAAFARFRIAALAVAPVRVASL
jgi:hypothetical protein